MKDTHGLSYNGTQCGKRCPLAATTTTTTTTTTITPTTTNTTKQHRSPARHASFLCPDVQGLRAHSSDTDHLPPRKCVADSQSSRSSTMCCCPAKVAASYGLTREYLGASQEPQCTHQPARPTTHTHTHTHAHAHTDTYRTGTRLPRQHGH